MTSASPPVLCWYRRKAEKKTTRHSSGDATNPRCTGLPPQQAKTRLAGDPGVAMHVAQFLDSFAFAPNFEIVEAFLPDVLQ